MKRGTLQRYILISLAVTGIALCSHEAAAFWGSDSTGTASGLDVSTGFDVNTITTITGMVVTPPGRKGQEHTELSMDSSRGTVTVVLGPWTYWEKHAITITKGQELTITGSLAQGKDGILYVFVQHLENRSTGETVTLRSESGKPLWSRTGTGGQGGNNHNTGSSPRSGSGAGTGYRGGTTRGGGRR